MASQVPPHLPRQAQTKERSTIVLEELGESSWNALNAAKSKQWLEQLDAAIVDATTEIHERLKNAEEEYKSTLDTAQGVLQGVDALEIQLQQLAQALHHPQVGVLVKFNKALSAYGDLSQQVLDSSTVYEAASFFRNCTEHYDSIKALLSQGRVTEVLTECQAFGQLSRAAPPPLNEAVRFPELMDKVREIENDAREQIRLECEKSLSVSQTFKGASLIIRQQIVFKGSQQPISFVNLLGTLHDVEIEKQLDAFRDDILSLLVKPITTLPSRYRIEETYRTNDISELSLRTAPNSDDTSVVLHDLQQLVLFLSDRFVGQLPIDSTYSANFRHSMSRSLTSLVLSELVQPSLPVSLQGVPQYLKMVEKAIRLEILINEKFISTHHSIDRWCGALERWYEENRVESLLARARDICESTGWNQLKVELEVEEDASSAPKHGGEDDENWGFDDDGWGFNENQGETDTPDQTSNRKELAEAEAGGWGGWGDEENEELQPETASTPKLISEPKSASRLEKLSSKARTSGPSHFDEDDNWIQRPTSNEALSTPSTFSLQPRAKSKTRSESYMITTRAISILSHVEAVIDEAIILRDSNVFGKRSRPTKRGKMLFQSAPAACDMLRSFFPGVSQSRDPREDIQLSCDFQYLNQKIAHVYRTRVENNKGDFEPKEEIKWEETVGGLASAAEMCMQNAIDNQISVLSQTLSGARGFKNTSEEVNFRRIESSVQGILRIILTTADVWKVTLSLTDYYNSIGSVVDAILLQVVDEIIALDDITEAESEKLADLCKQLEPIQNLFVDSDGESRVGAFVPSWFRFSYLKELLVASMADISYLFEQGMLLDYEVEELVKLIKALFADTPLRESAIRKVFTGRPVTG